MAVFFCLIRRIGSTVFPFLTCCEFFLFTLEKKCLSNDLYLKFMFVFPKDHNADTSCNTGFVCKGKVSR